MLRIENLKVYEDLTMEQLLNKAVKKAGIRESDLVSIRLIRKSIDARDKKDVHYVCTFDVEVKDEKRYPRLPKVKKSELPEVKANRKSPYRPVIIGSGPAGLFCALTLIEYGYKPVIIEQGASVEERMEAVTRFREQGILNTRNNVQFGEGGAGTFSDGKLTTGINSIYTEKVINTFHKFGAPEEITYLAHPHIGTDNLVNILKNIRTYIEEKGGEYHFNTRFEDVTFEKGIMQVICDKAEITTDCLVLAIGHSARHTFEMLKAKGFELKRKDFSVGVRIEHLQKDINKAQYGEETKLKLPPAEYKLVYHDGVRACYSFCMCPGGEVMASSSEEGGIVTNGMSNYRRDGVNANAALLVNVLPSDLEGDDPLAGLRFQKELEEKAFVLGGSDYYAPVQRFGDFKEGKITEKAGKVIPSYKPGYRFRNLNELFPDFVNETLKKGIEYFDRRLKGFGDSDSMLTAVESRTSSPVTIVRNEKLESNFANIYPCGEGAGYAGGITSAAVDGIKVALKIIEKSED